MFDICNYVNITILHVPLTSLTHSHMHFGAGPSNQEATQSE